ncbi:MAG: hypothetical protein IAE77_07115 [Prosthecobacter sp.]|uniref:hypothetical protein n=1 Tax=Prosthecobacter sp. TaxID=1965333 RepID=UPI0019E74D7D|nr:hypothetical protein [Prosthecobacter sp.]MBE2283214.1 hypothetical protein [Prosthecobacter sp.]
MALLAGIGLLASCSGALAPLRPAWQQDADLYHHGVPARASQTATTPHLVARAVYAAPDRIGPMMDRQGDVPEPQRGLARMGDGTVDLGFQDVATGRWIESSLCGGTLFVAGLPNQAYRIVVKNRTPLPLEVRVGVDGRDLATGAPGSLSRGGSRVEGKGTLTLEHSSQGPLLFRQVSSDAALFDTSAQGRPGLIQLAVFLASDAPSVGPEKMRPDQIAPLGLFPVGVPEQYR